MPPAVALWNYISSVLLWRIFFPNRDFRGVFFTYQDQRSYDGRGHYIFRVPNSLQGCDGWGKGRGILYTVSKPLWSSGKIYASGSPSSGLEKNESFCFWKFRGVSLYILSEGSAKLRWVGRVAHLGRGVAQKGVQRSSVGCSIA